MYHDLQNSRFNLLNGLFNYSKLKLLQQNLGTNKNSLIPNANFALFDALKLYLIILRSLLDVTH